MSDDHNSTDQAVVELHEVSKLLNTTSALHDISLSARRGEIIAFLGPTGSGRSLLFSVLLGLSAPDAGTIKVFGKDPQDPEVRERIGTTPHDTRFPGELRVSEIVRFVCSHYGQGRSPEELLKEFDFVSSAGRKTSTLNRAEERWLAVALAFAGKPDALILDLPTTGMDFDWRVNFWQRLRQFAEEANGTVLINTETTDLVGNFADRIIVLRDGQIFASGTVEDLANSAAHYRASIEEREPGPEDFDTYAYNLERTLYRLMRDTDLP